MSVTPEASTTVEALQGLNVLIVEDNGLLCCVLEETLRDAGCEIVGPFARLPDALEAAATEHIDVALLDINLRGQLVSPVAEQLRARGVPFVLTSAYQPHDLPATLQSAVQLRKPYTDTEVLDQLAFVVSTSHSRNN